MKFLFLDDSYQKNAKLLGHGGFCVDAAILKELISDITDLKRRYKIPQRVELKWSPDPHHFLRTEFKYKRSDLYRECIGILDKWDTPIICSIHSLSDCYGYKLHGWDLNDTKLWAAQEQFKYISERFEKPYLSSTKSFGLIVADNFADKDSERTLIRELSSCLTHGTEYNRFEKICMTPLMVNSVYNLPLQIADIVIGIIVSSFADNHYGLELFDDVGKLFFKNPHEGALSFASTFTSSVIGYGLKVFPSDLKKKARSLLKELDKKYFYTSSAG
jgi:hypothetical protein